MASIFTTRCSLCPKEFRTRKSLERHFMQKHPGEEMPKQLTFKSGDCAPELPDPRRLDQRQSVGYHEWLSGIVEGINSTHNPNVPGRWCHFTFPNVPLSYFSHFLYKIQSATVNSVKQVKHLKPPVWKDSTFKISYKTTSKSDVIRALEEQKAVVVSERKSFSGNKECNDRDVQELFGKEALEAAKRPRLRPSLISQITIENGEGRNTRECELIWYPLYEYTNNGVLTVRLYVGKVNL